MEFVYHTKFVRVAISRILVALLLAVTAMGSSGRNPGSRSSDIYADVCEGEYQRGELGPEIQISDRSQIIDQTLRGSAWDSDAGLSQLVARAVRFVEEKTQAMRRIDLCLDLKQTSAKYLRHESVQDPEALGLNRSSREDFPVWELNLNFQNGRLSGAASYTCLIQFLPPTPERSREVEYPGCLRFVLQSCAVTSRGELLNEGASAEETAVLRARLQYDVIVSNNVCFNGQ